MKSHQRQDVRLKFVEQMISDELTVAVKRARVRARLASGTPNKIECMETLGPGSLFLPSTPLHASPRRRAFVNERVRTHETRG